MAGLDSCIRVRSLTSALAALFLCVGCGGNAPDEASDQAAADAPSVNVATGPARDIDHCSLLTAAEIEEVTGTTPGPPETMEGMPECSWSRADGSGPMLVSVSAHYGTVPASFEEYVAYWEEMNEKIGESIGAPTPEVQYERVDGLGDFGVWEGDGETGGLEIFEDNLSLSVTTVAGGGRTARENSIDLAEKALARLR